MSTAWWHDFFDDDAIWLYKAILAPERTEEEVAGAVRLLRLKEGARLLDLGCGTGRHAIPLSRRGFHVTGIEWSPDALAKARTHAEAVSVTPALIRGDLGALPLREGSVDAAISIFSSLGYEGDATTARILAEARRVLKPGGRLLVEVLGRDRAVRIFDSDRDWTEVDGRIVRLRRSIDLVTGEERATFFYDRGEGPREKQFRRRLFTPTELDRMLREAGFAKVTFSGDWEGAPLGLDSPQLIAVARTSR